MIEVFKTTVNGREHADMLLARIHASLQDHEANFDLHDCDRILRVQCEGGPVKVNFLIEMLQVYGCEAEVLAG